MVDESRKRLLEMLDARIREAIGRPDEPDPVLDEIERQDEYSYREGKDVWDL